MAVGECGLDYHYEHSPRDDQRQAFEAQIALAAALDLTLVVHTRTAWDDTIDILRSTGVPERVVIHCFTGGPSRSAALSRSRRVSYRSAASSLSREHPRSATRPCSVRASGSSSRPMPRFSLRCLTVASPIARRG